MAEVTKSKSVKGEKPQTPRDASSDWKNPHPDNVAQSPLLKKEKGVGNYSINDVDLTKFLPVPLAFGFEEANKAKMAEFRKQSKRCTEAHSDYYIGRFLIARKWDVKAAVELFDNAMKWREDEGIDTILETFPHNYWFKALQEYWPTSITHESYRCAKDKCPVMYERIGLVNPKLADIIPRETLVKHHIYNVELMERENHRIAKEIGFSPGTILVEDLDDLAMGHLSTKFKALINEISVGDEQHFPESIRKVYIANPPGIFNLVWGLVKPMMEEHTVSKFAFGTPKDFGNEWDAVVGKENLPKYFKDSTSEWDIKKGGDVKQLFPKELVKVTIARGDKGPSIKQAVKKGQTFHWQVMCKKDLWISLSVEDGMNLKPVTGWAPKNYDEDLSPWHGWYQAPEDMNLVLLLDNTKNYTQRKVKYFTYVKDPIELTKKA